MIDIIVPYFQPSRSYPGKPWCDRREQLRTFLNLVPLFLRQHDYEFLITVCECGRELEGRYNRGMARNIALAETEADQVVFHDLDYIPISADYGPKTKPTRLITLGVRDPRTNLEEFFGGVVQLPRSQALMVNGYSNEFEHWGYEDTDFRDRLISHGLEIDIDYSGHFRAELHESEGFDQLGQPTRETEISRSTYLRHCLSTQKIQKLRDGVSTLDYEIIERAQIEPWLCHIKYDPEPWLASDQPYYRPRREFD